MPDSGFAGLPAYRFESMLTKIRQAGELARTFTRPGGIRAFLSWKPFSITSFQMLTAMRAQGLSFGSIIDAGANVGQFARASAEVFPGAHIISIEALPEVAETLRRNLAGTPNVHVVQTAVGAATGNLTFYRNEYSLASSALPIHPAQRESFPGASTAVPVQVPVTTLDDLLNGEDLPRPMLLKLDLQGYELEALKGATETLLRADYVLAETAFKTMYEGEALFEEVHDFLRQAGFRFLRPLDFLTDARGEIVQMDALFARAA